MEANLPTPPRKAQPQNVAIEGGALLDRGEDPQEEAETQAHQAVENLQDRPTHLPLRSVAPGLAPGSGRLIPMPALGACGRHRESWV